jgi:hypothetical protein
MDTNENQECSINKYSNSEDTNYDDYQDTIEGDHKLPEKTIHLVYTRQRAN